MGLITVWGSISSLNPSLSQPLLTATPYLASHPLPLHSQPLSSTSNGIALGLSIFSLKKFKADSFHAPASVRLHDVPITMCKEPELGICQMVSGRDLPTESITSKGSSSFSFSTPFCYNYPFDATPLWCHATTFQNQNPSAQAQQTYAWRYFHPWHTTNTYTFQTSTDDHAWKANKCQLW